MKSTRELELMKALIEGILSNKQIQERYIDNSHKEAWRNIDGKELDWEMVVQSPGLYRVKPEEDNDEFYITNYELEELDNGMVLRYIKEDLAQAALYGDMDKPPMWRDKNEVFKLIGKFIYGDIYCFQNNTLANKVHLKLKIEKA